MKKYCTWCKSKEEKKHFSKNSSKKDGLGTCKVWRKTYYKENKAEIAAKQKEYNVTYFPKYYNKNKTRIIRNINQHSKNKDCGLYRVYWSMIRRCKYPSQDGYKYYGGKGIRVEWKTYKKFKTDMYESYLEHLAQHSKKQTTIDRINSNGNYSKENCRWATYKEQVKNRHLFKEIIQ